MNNEIEREPRVAAHEKIALCAIILWPLIFAATIGQLVGCRHIEIDKHDPIPYPTATNAVAWIDGGYSFEYWNWGFKTDVDSITANKTTNGVEISIGKVQTDVSERHEQIVAATGTAVGNVAEKVIEGVKGVETIKAVSVSTAATNAVTTAAE